MKLNLLRSILVVFTLFSLLGQGVMANGYSIMPMTDLAHAKHAPNMLTASAEPAETGHCHENMPNSVAASEAATEPMLNCCDGPHQCKLDCNHCLSLGMSATLFSAAVHIPKLAPQPSLGFISHSFISQDTSPAFRPPII